MCDDVFLPTRRRQLLAGVAAAAVGGLAAGPVSAAESKETKVVPSICVFDVNETLLDIDSMAPLFQRVFGDKAVLREWFNQLILYSGAITLSGPYTTFFTLGQGILKMLGEIHNVPIQHADVEELRTGMLTMPAHPDVPPGLKQLKEAGFRLVTLTNSPPPDARANPLKHAGIDGWFEKSLSIDRVRRFKPAPQVYHMVAEELDVPPASICMVAAHTWDTIGAQSIGCSAALIARPGNAILPVHGLPQPQAVAPNLPGVATQLARLWRS
ncbi:haloacid dehalogenase type II [Bradyrhizobium sp. Ai1a-2]|uniref:haloacid dehalogenase type II n=1 Tax=Bradyrhizobium sp. Ai1a-2 TaxID=196490 RepID=UPI000A038D93|nr:haloacid dehalogenase type II [Bradyrhizobium sp. Ai1a-2]